MSLAMIAQDSGAGQRKNNVTLNKFKFGLLRITLKYDLHVQFNFACHYEHNQQMLKEGPDIDVAQEKPLLRRLAELTACENHCRLRISMPALETNSPQKHALVCHKYARAVTRIMA